jgi:hypothetical protein
LFVIRGSGFSSVSSAALNKWFRSGGLAFGSVSVTNDSTLVAGVRAPAVGTYAVGFENELGLASGAAIMTVVAPTPAPYVAHDTSDLGQPRTMVHDASRGDIYASYGAVPSSRPDTGTIVRFRPSGTTVTRSTLSIPGLIDIALSPDARVLVAADVTNTIHIIDPSSFSVIEKYKAPFRIGFNPSPNVEMGIAIADDQKVWLPYVPATGDGSFGLASFDLKSRTFRSPDGPCNSCLNQGNFAASRDGQQLLVASSPASFWYGESVSGSGIPSFTGGTSYSDRGNRLFANYSSLYGTRAKIGEAPRFPAEFTLRAAQISPDGERAYQLVSNGANWQVASLDTSDAGAASQLTNVGQFWVPDGPGCADLSSDSTNCRQVKMRVTPDGFNVILLGDRRLVLMSIPEVVRKKSVVSAPNWIKATVGF